MLTILTIMVPILFILGVGGMFWILWRIHRLLKEIEHSLGEVEMGLAVLCDQLTILLYLEIRDKPDLLEEASDLEKRALEAAERLGGEGFLRYMLPKPGGETN